MSRVDLGQVSIEYDTFGDTSNPTIVLVRGLGTQMIDWPAQFIDALTAAGFHVVIFDNRDVGLSTLNDMREAVGLSKYSDWDSFANNLRDPSQIEDFKNAYNSIDEVDLWVGGLDNLAVGIKVSHHAVFITCHCSMV